MADGKKPRVAVLGGGRGGQATAGHLQLQGFEVSLFSFFDSELEPIRERGGIELTGAVEGLAKPDLLTTSIDRAVAGADVVLSVFPALAHRTLATLLAPCLRDGQMVVLSPGRTGGAIEFARTASAYAISARITLVEAQTFIYATESAGPAAVKVMAVKKRVRVAALPAIHTSAALKVLNQIYPEYAAAQNVLETSLNNVGAVVHPAPMLLSIGTLERSAAGENLSYYRDVLTPSICELVLDKIDAEKVAVAKAFGLDAQSAVDWYHECYEVPGNTIYEVLSNNAPYSGYACPKHLFSDNHVLDEVPNSLVPLASLGELVNVATPTIRAIVDLACQVCDIDFWSQGRTLSRLGIDGKTPEQLIDFVERTEWATGLRSGL